MCVFSLLTFHGVFSKDDPTLFLVIDCFSLCRVPLGEMHSFSCCVYFSVEGKVTGPMSPGEWTQRRLFTRGSPAHQLLRVCGWRAGSYYSNGSLGPCSQPPTHQEDLVQWGCLINDSSEAFDTNVSGSSPFKFMLPSYLALRVFNDPTASHSSTSTDLKAGSTMEFSSCRLGLSCLTAIYRARVG